MIICGFAGTGKSTAAKKITGMNGWKQLSVGKDTTKKKVSKPSRKSTLSVSILHPAVM